jgi:hypothetical protein
MTSNRSRARLKIPQDHKRKYHPIAPDSIPESLQGDALLDWLHEHRPASVPTDAELAAVALIGEDLIREVDFHHYLLHDPVDSMSVEEVRAYFKREETVHPVTMGAIQSDDGARLNGYHRVRAERLGRPVARWNMAEALLQE